MDSVVVSKKKINVQKQDKNSKKKQKKNIHFPFPGAGALSMDVGEHLGNRESQMTNKPSGVNT